MFVYFSAKSEPITARPKVGDVALAGAASTIGIPRDTRSLGEHAARGARSNIKKGDHVNRLDVPLTTLESALTFENPEKLGRINLLVATLASIVVRSACPSYSSSVARRGGVEEKQAKSPVKAWRGTKVVEAIKTWGPKWVLPHLDEVECINTWGIFAGWESKAPTPSWRKVPDPVKLERALPLQEDTSKLRLDRTIELLTRGPWSHCRPSHLNPL